MNLDLWSDSQMSKEKHYIERNWDGSYRVMDAEEKAESDEMGIVAVVMIIGIIGILVNLGFSPWSFLAIVVWFFACILLRKVIVFLAGLVFLYLMGRFIWWLFFT